MPRQTRDLRLASVLVAVILAGCSAGATNAPSTPAQAPSPSATVGATATPPPIDKAPFVFSWSSNPDEVYLPVLMAIDAMQKEGYRISGQQVASDDILYQGLSSNTIQAGIGGLSQVANAVAAGVAVKIFDTRNSNPTVYVAAKDYQDCKKLDGQPVGIRSPKAIYTLFMTLYFDANCPGIKYTSVTISESNLRAQAMEQGQILATVLGLPDAIALDKSDPGKFYLVTFGATLPGIGDEYLIANNRVLQDHPAIAAAFVEEHLKAIRALYAADDATLTALEKQFLPGVTDESTLKTLLTDKQWYANGGLSGDGLERSLSTFKLPGDRATLVDSGPMTTALSVVGQSNLTDR